MSDYEIITDGGRRRRLSSSEKLRIVEETLDGAASISSVVRRNGIAPDLLYRWRRLMPEEVAVAVSGDDDVTCNRALRQMEDRIRERAAASRAQGLGGQDPEGSTGTVAPWGRVSQ